MHLFVVYENYYHSRYTCLVDNHDKTQGLLCVDSKTIYFSTIDRNDYVMSKTHHDEK
jgi:hypothetical protein